MLDPKELRFQESHEWVAPDGTVGLSQHAQSEIGDVVFADLPKVGRTVKRGEAIAVLESVKAAFDLYAPVAGEIVAVNDEIAGDPSLINREPYGRGWLFRIAASDPAEREVLMDSDAYDASTGHGGPHGGV